MSEIWTHPPTSIVISFLWNFFNFAKPFSDIYALSDHHSSHTDQLCNCFLQETYGEDPYLSGSLAAAFVKGLQGEHPRYIRANAGCKHFDVHGGPENIPSSRFDFDAQVIIYLISMLSRHIDNNPTVNISIILVNMFR